MVRCLLFSVAVEIDGILDLFDFGEGEQALFDLHRLGS